MPALQNTQRPGLTKGLRRGRVSRESFLRRNGPVLWFVSKFLGAVLAFYLLSLSPLSARMHTAYLTAVAASAHAVLRAAGVECQLLDATIWSGKYSVTVGPQCSGVELAWFLAAAMLAFPAAWKSRVIGLVAGLTFLVSLNIIRVSSLYLVGVHAPAHFAWVHESGWPTLLILATLGIMGLWIGRLGARESLANEPAY